MCIEWRPKEKIKTTAMLRIYDLAGRVSIKGKPSKLEAGTEFILHVVEG